MGFCMLLGLLAAAAAATFDQYLEEVRKRVEAAWKPPAKSAGLQAVARFTLDRAGRVSDLKLVKSSGNRQFDESALQAVRANTPFPSLALIFKRSETREVEITFKRDALSVREWKPAS
jgi:protein TonB